MRRTSALLLSAFLLPACAGTPTAPEADRGRLDCRSEREPAVVFIPGASRGAEDWNAVRDALAPGVKTCGWEPPRSGPRTAGSDARLLLSALQGRAERWVLVGHSYGGLVVRVAADAAPDRLAGALFVDSVHEDLFDPAQAPPVTEKQHIDWIPSFHEATSVPLPGGVPVLALVADHHGALSEHDLAVQRKLVARGAPGEVQVVERSSHHIPRDRPEAIAEAVRRLFARPATPR